jgi:tetratricopeptide (TPR) repeat protein
MLKLGLIQMANGDLDTAYVTFMQVLHAQKKVFGWNHVQVAKILNLIGYLQYEFGSLLAALKSMEEALEILRDQDETTAADTLANMGFLYFKLGDYNEAIAVYQEAYYMQKRLLGDFDPKTIVTCENLEYVRQQSSPSIVLQASVYRVVLFFACTLVCVLNSHIMHGIAVYGSIRRLHEVELQQQF